MVWSMMDDFPSGSSDETPVPQCLLWLDANLLIDSVVSVFQECAV